MSRSYQIDQACPGCGHTNALGQGNHFCPKCRFPLVVVANKYRFIQKLAQGGFGSVYLAQHIHLQNDSTRVIKVMKPEVMDMPGMETRFFREVRITATLSQRNEHIVRIYDDFGKEEALGYYYIMEYLEGQNLNEMIYYNKRIPVEQALPIFDQLCNGIAEAHRADVVHRDLKPENIILIQRHQNPHFVKILDFGIAKPIGDNSQPNLTRGVIGTPAYMSPEQCQGQNIGPQTDIYASGTILYEMLTGQTPFGQQTADNPSSNAFIALLHAQITQPPPSMRLLQPSIPEELDQIVLRSLAKQPEERYATMDEFRQALLPFYPKGHIIVPPPSSSPQLAVGPLHSTHTPGTLDRMRVRPSGDSISAFVTPETQVPIPQTKTQSSGTTKWLVATLLLLVLVLGGGLAYTIMVMLPQNQKTNGTTAKHNNPLSKTVLPIVPESVPRPTPKTTPEVTKPTVPPPQKSPVAPSTPTSKKPPKRAKTPPHKIAPKRAEPRRVEKKRRLKKKRRRRRRRDQKAQIPRPLPPAKRNVAAIQSPSDVPTHAPPDERKSTHRIPRRKPPKRRAETGEIPTHAPPSQRRRTPPPRGGSSIRGLLALGKSVERYSRRGSYSLSTLRRARSFLRGYEDQLLQSASPRELKPLKKYVGAAQHLLLLPHRRAFLRLRITSRDREYMKKYKYIMSRFSSYIRKVGKLYRHPQSAYYLCGFFYMGEAYEHISGVFYNIPPSNSMDRVRQIRNQSMRKTGRQLSHTFLRSAKTTYSSGLRMSSNTRASQYCLPKLRSGFRRLRNFQRPK